MILGVPVIPILSSLYLIQGHESAASSVFFCRFIKSVLESDCRLLDAHLSRAGIWRNGIRHHAILIGLDRGELFYHIGRKVIRRWLSSDCRDVYLSCHNISMKVTIE